MKKLAIKKLGSYISPITSPLNEGGRIMQPAGELVQIVSGEVFRHLAYIEFDPKAPVLRGNHYHALKEECLYIIKGRLRAIYKDLETNEVQDVILEAGDLVNVKPYCAHVYFPSEYSQAVEFSSFPFDATDIHKYVIAEGVQSLLST